ncbi:MAG: hypothetical protein RR893_04705 [Clostridia bacterium]
MKMHERMLLLALPLLAVFLLFYILPFCYSIYYSVIESAFSHQFVGLKNYIGVFANNVTVK